MESADRVSPTKMAITSADSERTPIQIDNDSNGIHMQVNNSKCEVNVPVNNTALKDTNNNRLTTDENCVVDLTEEIIPCDIMNLSSVIDTQNVNVATKADLTALDTTLTDPFNESDNPGQFIVSSNPIQTDIENNVFCDTVLSSKRVGKCKLLQEEIFDNSVYVNKQCGFTTSRPLHWAQKVDNYIYQDSDVTGKVFYKAPKCNTDIYYIIKFVIYFQTNKQVTILINLFTGIFMVKGTSFQTWIDEEFQKLSENTISKQPPAQGKESEKSVESLWEISMANKVAITNLDENSEKVSKEFSLLNEKLNLTIEEVDETVKGVAKSCDEKIMSHFTLVTETFDKQIESIVKTYNQKISCIHNMIGKLKIDILKQLDETIEPCKAQENEKVELENLRDAINKQNVEINDTIKDYKIFTSKNDDDNELAKLVKEIEKLKDDLDKKIDKPISMPRVDSAHLATNTPSLSKNLVNSKGKKDIELLYCMDSNRKHVDFRRLWTLKGSHHKQCGNLNELKRYLDNHDITSLNYVLINIGVNDIDVKSSEDVFKDIKSVVDQLILDFPNVRIILSEIPPRTDEKDNEVIKCNELINERGIGNVTIACHSNLCDEEYTMFKGEDNVKHISKDAIPRFCSNLKRALRKAHGYDEFYRDSRRPEKKNNYGFGGNNSYYNNRSYNNYTRNDDGWYSQQSNPNNTQNRKEKAKHAFLRLLDQFGDFGD